MTALAPASFEVERFELAGDECVEVRGRWSGVRGRRFMRPTLTAVAGGREQRILAVLDHKHGPVFDPLADPDFFAQVRVDNELGTVVWPNGADLDPLVLHGDFEPAPRFVHR